MVLVIDFTDYRIFSECCTNSYIFRLRRRSNISVDVYETM